MPTYDCQVFRQRESDEAPEFCLFHAPVGEILDWCDIKRLEADPGGAQRSLNGSRVRSVKRFLEDTANTIPTAIVIALDLPPANCPQGGGPRSGQIRIEIPEGGQKPGVVIDGQHRLLGVQSADAAIHLNVVALLTNNLNEAAFQFFIINNKSAKVSTDHIKALLAERADERLQQRLRKARLSVSAGYEFVATADTDDESPFMALIDWPTNREGKKWIKPAAVETAIRFIQERKVREFENEDLVIELFFTMWRILKDKWPALWVEESRLLSKVGVVCMTQYLTSLLVSAYDLGDLDITILDAIDRRVRAALQFQVEEFWTVPWSSKSYDTAVGHKIIVDALVQIGRNVRTGIDWRQDVTVVASD